MVNEDQRQEEEYRFPYHHLPEYDGEHFYPVRYWPWSHRYIGSLKVISNQLENLEFDSLLDVGCGDGRFLNDLKQKCPEKEFLGIDISDRAIQFARAFNPSLTFRNGDITELHTEQFFDAITLVEVLEHIHPEKLHAFIDRIADQLNEGGHVIITVPHKNKDVIEKHYQHFDSDELRNLLSAQFDLKEIIYLDPPSRLLGLFHKLLGGKGHYYLITHPRIRTWFFSLYLKLYLFAQCEEKSHRIMVIGRKK